MILVNIRKLLVSSGQMMVNHAQTRDLANNDKLMEMVNGHGITFTMIIAKVDHTGDVSGTIIHWRAFAQMFRVWYITYLSVNAGKYTSTMEHSGSGLLRGKSPAKLPSMVGH